MALHRSTASNLIKGLQQMGLIRVDKAQADKRQVQLFVLPQAQSLLAQVERAFLSMKPMDLKVRPIHHHLEGRVRAHMSLCMLAYYVECHMREAWREMMFADCDQAAKLKHDPVAPAKRTLTLR